MSWQELSKHRLNVYTTPWCSDCRRFKDVLRKNNIEFNEIDIDADTKAAEYLSSKTGKKAIPYLEIDDKIMIRGWHKEASGRWDESIFFAEITPVI